LDTKELLKDGLAALGIQAEADTCDKFMRYKALLQEWNQKMNLTAITEDKEVVVKHFLDSASVFNAVKIKPGLRVVDVGSGAGFPGVPFKLLSPDSDMLLLDSLQKRIHFLNEVIAELDLKRIETVHMRAEDAGRDFNYRAQFDLCLSRAVARLSVLAEYCLPLVKIGGDFVAMKGPDVAQEISEAEIAVEALGGEIVDVKTVLLPHSDINHTFIVIKKNRQTSKKYPRIAAMISKIPIE
jgi:16S rRNA (guanine527-N7)-methyltransferase